MASSSRTPRSSKGRPERLELAAHVPGADAHDHPTAADGVDGGERLGHLERVAVGGHVDVAHEAHALGAPASQARVATVSHHSSPMVGACSEGMAMWSHTAT
jgi:hypothetical protein